MAKPFSIGVDLGGTNLRAAVISREGNIIKKEKIPSSGDVLEGLIKSINNIFSKNIHGIGLAIAGTVDKKRSVIDSSPNLPIIEEINFVEILNKRFDIPVCLDNDASLATLGESISGAGKGLSSFVLFTLGTGIGGGVIYKNKLMDIASEIGHMTVSASRKECQCGNWGCLEVFAGARAIMNMIINEIKSGEKSSLTELSEDNFRSLTTEAIYSHALNGDELAVSVLKKAGRYLGIGIANVINIFSPDAVILTGGLIGAWDIYVKEAIGESSKRAFKKLYKKAKIIPSTLGDNAGLIGAAHMAFGL